MATFTIQDVSRQSGMSEPTIRYYEQVGLVGPIDRDESSGHRRYNDDDATLLHILACLRAVGVGIADMRTYKANLARRKETAGEQRDISLRHAKRIEEEIAEQQIRLKYLHAKADVWDARERGDVAAADQAMKFSEDIAKQMGVGK